MLKALLLLLTNLALAGMATAQNLVQNPSFEDTTLCTVYDPIRTPAIYWYNANTATPDIWDCDTVRRCGNHIMDPNNDGIQIIGYKYAYDGDRFAGGFHWYGANSSNTREYLTSRLLQPLIAGQSYRVSLWVARPAGYNGAIDHIGAYFGPDSVHLLYPTTLPFQPQAELRDPNSTYLDDTAWVQVADTFVAVGGEQWIIIGTFEDADEVDGIWLGWGGFPPHSYYFIDLVSVEPIQPLSIGGLAGQQARLIANGSVLYWTGPAPIEQLGVLDGSGRTVWRFDGASTERTQVAVPERLPSGVYVALALSQGARYAARFVK